MSWNSGPLPLNARSLRSKFSIWRGLPRLGEGWFRQLFAWWATWLVGSLFGSLGMFFCCPLISVLELTFSASNLVILLFFLTFPFWVKVRFINFERTKLPAEILKHNLEEKRKYFSDICLEVERSDAEVQVSCWLSYFSLIVYVHACICLSRLALSLWIISFFWWHRLRVCTIKGFRIWLLLLTRWLASQILLC